MPLSWSKVDRHRYTASGAHEYVIDLDRPADRYYLEIDGARVMEPQDPDNWVRFYYLREAKALANAREPAQAIVVQGRARRAPSNGDDEPSDDPELVERLQRQIPTRLSLLGDEDDHPIVNGMSYTEVTEMVHFATLVTLPRVTLTKAFCPICRMAFVRFEGLGKKWEICPKTHMHYQIESSEVVELARMQHWSIGKKMKAIRQLHDKYQLKRPWGWHQPEVRPR